VNAAVKRQYITSQVSTQLGMQYFVRFFDKADDMVGGNIQCYCYVIGPLVSGLRIKSVYVKRSKETCWKRT